jgi:peptidoglycan/xylan/chitin deacetylase (PgdA/CDA1 family)
LKLVALARSARNSHLSWKDLGGLVAGFPPVGELPGNPLARVGIGSNDFDDAPGPVQFLGATQYLNGAKAVVCHTVDDSCEQLLSCLDAMDRYGIKATAFVTTGYRSLMPKLWPRLRQAIADGHEVGSHSRRHPCRIPETAFYCFRAMTWDEIDGSRKDILENTGQPHVWSWAYPCGNCAERQFIQRKIARAGYLAARAYPDELQYRHVAPDLQTYDSNPYSARYTQVVQKGYTKTLPDKSEIAVAGQTDVSRLNAKFDEVHAAGGIYSFLSHPQMLDYGPDSFYELHLSYIAGREHVWYVPMGPLYAYRNLLQQTRVQALKKAGALARFAVFNRIDPKIYNGSITLRFRKGTASKILVDGAELSERAARPVERWHGQYFRTAGDELLVTLRPNTIVEFRAVDRSV